MIQAVQTTQIANGWRADFGAVELPSKAASGPESLSAAASLLALEHGLYALDIGETAPPRGEIGGRQAPIVQVSVMPGEGDRRVEIIGETWLGHRGGTVLVKSPPDGGHVLVTAYGVAPPPEVEIRRLDRFRSGPAALRPAAAAEEPEEIGTEIVLHVERLGDRRFPGEGWVGNRGKKLRVEAFSIRPVDALTARDIEFMAAGPNGRQTPWVTDAKLCGTRGQGLPLTGFAVRLSADQRDRFDIAYQGAFFEGGAVGPKRNGELCCSPIPDDPLEAITVRLTRRPAR